MIRVYLCHFLSDVEERVVDGGFQIEEVPTRWIASFWRGEDQASVVEEKVACKHVSIPMSKSVRERGGVCTKEW